MTQQARVLVRVVFVCTNNFVRSPMAALMFGHQIQQRGLSGAVGVGSAGTYDDPRWGTSHVGGGVAEPAGRVLRSHGYPTAHRAAKLSTDHLSANLVVALARNHARKLSAMDVPGERVRLLRSFDPCSGGQDFYVADPFFASDLPGVFTMIEASLPGLHDWVDERLAARGMAS